jgi:predicted nucleic acid-binding protein
VQSTVTIAENARNLRWIHGLALKGADAIHVASAIAMKCDEFITTDEKGLLKRAEALAKLNMRVCRPSDTRLLPPEFLQENLPLG